VPQCPIAGDATGQTIIKRYINSLSLLFYFTLCHLLQVSYKEKGKITLKMRKQEAGRWLDRWSPRREQLNGTDLTVTAGDGQPIITPPSDDDSD